MENLNEEILKIREMMGLKSKTLLTEGIGDDVLAFIKNTLDDIKKGISTSKTEKPYGGDEYKIADTVVSEEVYNDFINFKNNAIGAKTFEQLDDKIKNIIIGILKKDETGYNKFLEFIYKNEISKLWEGENVNEKIFLDAFLSKVKKKGYTDVAYDDEIDNIFTDLTNEQKTFIRDIFKKKKIEIENGTFKPLEAPTGGKSLTADEINKLSKKFDRGSIEWWEGLTQIIKRRIDENADGIWDKLKSFLKSDFEKKEKFLLKKMEEDFSVYQETISSILIQNPKNIDELKENLKKAFTLKYIQTINSLNFSKSGYGGEIWGKITKDESQNLIPKDVIEFIKNSEEKYTKDFYESISGSGKVESFLKNEYVNSSSRFKDLIMSTVNTLTFSKINYFKDSDRLIKSIIKTDTAWFLTTSTWLNIRRYVYLAQKYSWGDSKCKWLYQGIIASYGMYMVGFFMSGVLNTIKDGLIELFYNQIWCDGIVGAFGKPGQHAETIFYKASKDFPNGGDIQLLLLDALIKQNGFELIYNVISKQTSINDIYKTLFRGLPLGGAQGYDASFVSSLIENFINSVSDKPYEVNNAIYEFLFHPLLINIEPNADEQRNETNMSEVDKDTKEKAEKVKIEETDKQIEEQKKKIADIINGKYQASLNYKVRPLEQNNYDISEPQKINLQNKIVYTGDTTNFDKNSFVVRVGGKDIKVNGTSPYEPLNDKSEINEDGWESIGFDIFGDRKKLWEPVEVSNPTNTNTNTNTTSPTNTSGPKDKEGVMNETIIKKGSIMNEIFKRLMEQDEEKTLKMKDWDEIFTFQKVDDKNPGKFKDVEIKMDVVMDRMPHWRKKYKKECEDLDNCDDDGEDDSFVRAVIDTHPDVVRILFTKGLAHITSSNDQEDLNEGLHGLLSLIREAKNVEVEVWSVYRHPSSPDKIWSLVKGDYKQKELASMDVKMQQSPQNSTQKKTNSLDELKKKESNSIKLLSTDEKKGIDGLPLPLKKKVREMIKKGWTTELPSSKLMKFHKEDEMKSVFGDVIRLYKLKPNEEFFNFLKDSDLDNSIKRGFCRSIYYVEKEFDLPKDKMSKVNDILGKCKNKFEGKYGQNYL